MADKANKTVVVYVATYSSLDDANVDYEAVKQLHSAGIIGTYDAAVISKDAADRHTHQWKAILSSFQGVICTGRPLLLLCSKFSEIGGFHDRGNGRIPRDGRFRFYQTVD